MDYTPLCPKSYLIDRPVKYAELSPEGYVVQINAPSSLKGPLNLPRRPDRFRVLEAKDVTLVGFRTFTTDSGHFFNDESILPDHDITPTALRFSRGLHEDTNSSFVASILTVPEGGPLDRIEEPVICVNSDEQTNYGSLIYRTLPKLVELHEFSKLPILVAADYAPWLRQLFQAVHGPIRVRHQSSRRRYRIANALVPSVRNHGVFFDDVSLDFYRSVADRVGGKSSLERIYLSRRAVARKRPGFRTLENEDELIAVLAARNIVAVELENLPFEEQFRIIRDARLIVAPGGSGLFNAVFASNAEFVLDIEPNRTWMHAHHTLLKSCRLPHAMLFGEQLGSSAHSPWTVSIPAVLDALGDYI